MILVASCGIPQIFVLDAALTIKISLKSVVEAKRKGAATRYDSPARSLPIALYMGQS